VFCDAINKYKTFGTLMNRTLCVLQESMDLVSAPKEKNAEKRFVLQMQEVKDTSDGKHKGLGVINS
jgi:hypothetical protein